ncbi:MAG: sugar ABC transporter permease, partial [Oscillospiraceae bacterium]
MTVKQKDSLTGVLFASPFLIGFVVFFVAPFLVSVVYTFTFGTGGGKFVGLKNYIDVLNSEAFKRAAWNTFRFIGMGVPMIMILSMVFSLLLQKKFGGASFYRSVFLFPLVIPIASTVMVLQLFFAQSGILNTMYASMGIPIVEWLNSKSAFGVLIFLYIWKNCGYNMVLLMSGLNSIPHDFYEVAQL